MHYFKGIGILILGFVSGVIVAGFFVEDSLTKIETANNEIQQVMFNAVESASEIDLIEARGKLEAVKALLAAYKDNSDLSVPIAKELDSIKASLKKDEQYLKNMNERVQRLHMDLQKDFEIVLSDYEFYIEPL